MAVKNIGIIMNGVTGRMGTNQHLVRSIVAIREQGGVELANGDVIMPDPILVGRNKDKLQSLAEKHNISRWSTDLDECLADPHNVIYFDSQTTVRRADAIRKAIKAGKHIYCEKPTAASLEESIELAKLAYEAGVKNGVVQDKLFLPGLLKLKRLIDSGFSAKSYPFKWNLATGYLKETGRPDSVHHGITGRKMEAGLLLICLPIGDMSLITYLEM